MNVLMLTTNSSLLDGINRHILTVAPAVNKHDDCKVAVCTVFPRAVLAEELERQGVKTYSLNASSGHDWHIIPQFIKVMKEYQPDIIHAHVMAMFERIVLSILYHNKRYINTVHGIVTNNKNTARSKLENILNKVFSIPYSAYCVVSNGVRKYCFGEAAENVYTIYNPLMFGKVSPQHYKLHEIIKVSKDTPIIGTACRIADVKNPVAFTKVMCRVLQEYPKAHAVVMGDGPEHLKNRIYEIIKDTNVEDRFHCLGYRQDAPELVRDLDCFVLTSISEGMPTSILESMANKTPFAMMEGMGGLNDIADINASEGPIGIIVPKGDIEGMAKEICNLLDNPKMQTMLAEQAYITGKKYFDIDSVSKQLYDVYKKVINK